MIRRARPVLRSVIAWMSMPMCLAGAQTAGTAPADSGIEVQVVDRSGAIVVGARVSLSDDTGREVRSGITGPYGIFRTIDLFPGSYSLRVECPGFHVLSQTTRIDSGTVSKLRLVAQPRGIVVQMERHEGLVFLTGHGPIGDVGQVFPDFELQHRSPHTLDNVLPPQSLQGERASDNRSH